MRNGEKSLYEKANRFSGEVIFAAAGVLSSVAALVPLDNTIIIPGKDYKQIIIYTAFHYNVPNYGIGA